MKTLLRCSLLASLLLASLPACGDASEDTPAATPELTAGQQRFGASFPGDLLDNVPSRETPSLASSEDIRQAIDDQNTFARDLFALAEEQHPGQNAFFSPLSISTALSMALPEANNAEAIRRNLHLSLPDAQLHPANNGLQLELLKHSGGQRKPEDAPVIFNLANGIWLDSTGMTAEERAARIELGDTSGIFGRYYDSPIALLDLRADPAGAEELLNAWVSDRTNGLIPELLQGNINASTRAVFINALYFKGAWAQPFEESLTRPDAFTLEDGASIQAPTFHAPSYTVSLYQREDLEVVALPYVSEGLEMVILIPPRGALSALADELSPELLEEVAAGLSPERVRFSMPGFHINVGLALSELLEDPSSSALHQAIIRVDEEGTEAAAATATNFASNAPPEPERELKIDRPFLFMIWDRPSRTVAFMGKVVDPR